MLQLPRWVLWELQVDSGGVDPHSGGVDPHQEAHHLDLEEVQLHRRQSRRNLHLKETRSMEEYHECIIGIICILCILCILCALC